MFSLLGLIGAWFTNIGTTAWCLGPLTPRAKTSDTPSRIEILKWIGAVFTWPLPLLIVPFTAAWSTPSADTIEGDGKSRLVSAFLFPILLIVPWLDNLFMDLRESLLVIGIFAAFAANALIWINILKVL